MKTALLSLLAFLIAAATWQLATAPSAPACTFTWTNACTDPAQVYVVRWAPDLSRPPAQWAVLTNLEWRADTWLSNVPAPATNFYFAIQSSNATTGQCLWLGVAGATR